MNQITEKAFSEDVLTSDDLVVVDFWAEWCGPCRMLKPVLDELSQEYDDVKIVAVDVDKYPNVSASQSIRGIPTIGFYKKGIMIERIVGAVSKSRIKERIDVLKQ